MTNAEIAERDYQHQLEAAAAMDQQRSLKKRIEEATGNRPDVTVGVRRIEEEITVGEFLKMASRVVGDAFDVVHKSNTFDNPERRLNRIGKHVDIKRKKASDHTKRGKAVDKTKSSDKSMTRRSLVYQIRTLPNGRGFALYYADGVDHNDLMRESKDIVKHWLGYNGYEALDSGAARVFESAEAARKFRREHFNLPTHFENLTSLNLQHEAGLRESRRAYRRSLGNRLARNEVRRTAPKKPKAQRKVRQDLLDLYKILAK